jgi:hypothetical protein
MKIPIPRSALEHHLAFVGKTGSGKTGSAKSGIIEPALAAGERVCVIDPTGAWWGLRLAADGKAKGLPIYVFGGDHGDYPLLATQGEMMAEAIGGSNTPAILDTTKLRTGERMKFFTDFADTILRANQGPLRLVIDEAHLFAPQAGTRGAGAMPDMLHAANNLISLGRSRGLRIVLISQRPAKVHKDSLTQVETLVAMRLIAPQDRKAVEEWIADQADKETGKEIIASLPSLKNGEAWVWSPEAHFLKRVTFPLPSTYDSSRVQGTGKAAKRLSPIDLEKLQEKFAKVKTEAEAKDPKALQRKVAELEAQLRKVKPAAPAPSIDAGAIAAAEARAFKKGFADAATKATIHFNALKETARATVRNFASAFDTNVKAERLALVVTEQPKSGSLAPAKQRKLIVTKNTPTVFRAHVPPVKATASGDGSLTGPQLQLLQALNWWHALGHEQPTRVQVAAIAKWKPKGSNLRNRLSELSSKGLVVYPRDGLVSMTDDGAAVAPAPDEMGLIDSLKAVMTGPQKQLFEQLLLSGSEPVTRDELATAVKWEPGGSNLRNRLSELSAMEVVTYPGKGNVALQDWVVA